MIRLHKINVKKVILIFFEKINNIILLIKNLITKLKNNKIYYITGNYSIRLYILKIKNLYDDINFYKLKYPEHSEIIDYKLELLKPILLSIEYDYYNYLTSLFLYKLNNYVVESLDIFKKKYTKYIDFEKQKKLYTNFDIFIKNIIKLKININKYITNEKYDKIQLSYSTISNLIKDYMPNYLDSMEYYKYFNNKNLLNYKQINHMYKLNNRFGYRSILNLF
jgi:hypothetical protein